jgi:aromatic ring-opening dioxygenase LigB subunit
MPLKSANLLPHSPLLIPEIAQMNYAFFKKTNEAYAETAEKLITKDVETIIIISSHAEISKDSFCLNVAPEMIINLKEFGFIPPKTIIKSDAIFADQINSKLGQDFPIEMISESVLDHGSAIPIFLLKNLGLNKKIIVISPASELDANKHYDFGLALGKLINESEKNIAIIASGDLSHRLKRKSPGGYSPKGAKFDNKIIENLSTENKAAENLLKMEEKLINEAGECAYKSLIISLGILNEKSFESKIMAYQNDFGVGYLSVDFKF